MLTSHSSNKSNTARNAKGFTLIELIVVISIVAISATVALDKLFWYQGQAEKASMDYTANMIKSGLWMSGASLMMANRGAEIPMLAEKNPINLLAQKPDNYLGELDGSKTEQLIAGNWFYDTSKKQVAYIVSQRRNFTPAIADDYTVRYSMKIIYSEIEITPGKRVPYVAGITLVSLSKYNWK